MKSRKKGGKCVKQLIHPSVHPSPSCVYSDAVDLDVLRRLLAGPATAHQRDGLGVDGGQNGAKERKKQKMYKSTVYLRLSRKLVRFFGRVIGSVFAR